MSTAVTPIRSGAAPLLPIYPSSLEDVVRLARMAIIGGMIKPITKGYGDKAETEDGNALEARATMLIMQGMELGIPPMMAIQLLAMINGRITAHSEAVPGILLSKGFKIKQTYSGTPMTDEWTATCQLTRPDGEVFTSSFSVSDAKQAKLWDEKVKVTKRGKNNSTYEADNDSAWHKYPKRMLWARALGFAAKDGGADAMKGLIIREEMEDMIRMERMREPQRQVTIDHAVVDASPDEISRDQLLALEALIAETNTDLDQFKRICGVVNLSDILAVNFSKAETTLLAKKAQMPKPTTGNGNA